MSVEPTRNAQVTAQIRQRFRSGVLSAREFREELTLEVSKNLVPELLNFLRDTPGLEYTYLVDISCVDYLKMNREPRFAVVYHLCSRKHTHRVRVKALVPEDDLKLATVSHIWAGADWLEREVYDMFGIEFSGHPDPRRILTWDDCTVFPLRKDYPVKGIGERDSFPILTREAT